MISFSQALRATALAVVLSASSIGYAETSIPARTGWVQDTTGTLTASDISQLSVKADQIAKSTGAVVVSLMVDTTDGEVIDDYAMRVAEAWHPGKAGVDKAAVLVIAKADKKWAIKTTRELGVTFTDVQAKVTLNKMRDYLKSNKGNFAGAMNVFYDQANKFSQPEVAAVAPPQTAVTTTSDFDATAFVLILLFIIVVAIGFAVYASDRGAEKRKKEEQDRLDRMISTTKRSYPSFNAYGSSVPPVPRRPSPPPPPPRKPKASSRVERRSERSDSSDLVDSLLDAAVLSSVFSSSSSKAEESKKESDWSSPDTSSIFSGFDGGGSSGGFD